jgi:Fic-DOC domain mobile mystery protein B
MLGNVWKWAGSFRNSDKNIGIDKHQIAIALRLLLDDCKYWIDNNTYSGDEIAVRFKHRIVSIHCFANGNGRHSRLMGDVIIEKIFRLDVFTWGAKTRIQTGQLRAKYLAALHEADRGNYTLLLEFARS